MKFGQLIEYSNRNILLEKSNKKCGRETSPTMRMFCKEYVLYGFSSQETSCLDMTNSFQIWIGILSREVG